MRNVFIVLILSFFPFLLFDQSEARKDIPGTKCSIIPPATFKYSDQLSGFVDSNAIASIVVVKMQTPINKLSADMTENNLAQAGMTLISKEKIMLGKLEGTYGKTSQVANGSKYTKQLLVIGNGVSSVMVVGTSPEGKKQIEDIVKSSMLTVVYKPN